MNPQMETKMDQLLADLKKQKEAPAIAEIETMGDVIAEKMEEETWLIERVLPDEGFTFIVGAEATGKSFYTLTIANSIIKGTDWLDKFPTKKKTRVLFMDKENSRRRLQSRLVGLGVYDSNGEIFRMKSPHLFSLVDGTGEPTPLALSLSNLVKENKIGLIVLDSFADFMMGNENNADDVQKFFTVMRFLFPTQSILVLHHENKPIQGIARTSSQRVRGSTNITAQLVSGFRVFAIPKTTNEFVIEQFKAGDAEKIKPFKVRLVSTPTMGDSTKTYVSSVKYEGEYYDEESKAQQAEELIMDFFLERNIGSRKELLEYCTSNGVSQRSSENSLRDLVDNNKLEKKRTGMEVNYVLL